jgi:hypothetical protein
MKKEKATKTIRIISFILVTFVVLGCKDNSTEPPPVEYEPLIPLSVGNYWLYQNYLLDPNTGLRTHPEYNSKDGFIINDSLSQSMLGSNFISYNISICGEDLKPIDDTNYLLFGGSKLIYQNNNGFYYSGIVRKDKIVMLFNDLVFPYPATKGKSTNGHVFYYSTTGNGSNVPDEIITQYTCISTDSLFTTPLGDFRCIVYKMAWQDFEPLFRDDVYYFIKPGLGIVGIVQKVYFYKLNKYNYMREYILTDYKIK